MLKNIQYPQNLPVKITALTIENYPMHYHSDIQIIYVLKGEIELKVSYKIYNLKKNDMHIINRTDVHAIRGKLNENIILIYNFNLNYYERYYKDIKEKVFIAYQASQGAAAKKNAFIRNCMFTVISELIKRESDYIERIKETSDRCVWELYDKFQYFGINSEKEFRSLNNFAADKYKMERINRVITNIYERYSEKITLTEIAESEHINKYYLSHLIKSIAGENFHDFLNLVRVEFSEQMLLDTDKSIQAISLDCGFSSAQYFNTSFEKWFGMRPKQYREKYKKTTIKYVEPVYRELNLNEVYSAREEDHEKPEGDSLTRAGMHTITLDFRTDGKRRFDFFNNCRLYISNPNILLNNYAKKNIGLLLDNIKGTGGRLCMCPETEGREGSARDDECNDTNEMISRILSAHIEESRLKPVKEIHIDDPGIAAAPLFYGGNGIINVTGFCKPSYYAYYFLSQLNRAVIKQGKNYIFTGGGNKFQLLLFTGSQRSGNTEQFMIQIYNSDKSYRITERKLDAQICSASQHWLNMRRPQMMQEPDIGFICESSVPAVKYEVLSYESYYSYNVSIEPPGAVLLQFHAI